MDKYVSKSAYARMHGCSISTVDKAIDSGKIPKKAVYLKGKRKVINVKMADKEWAKHFNPVYSKNPTLLAQFGGEKAKESQAKEEQENEEEEENEEQESSPAGETASIAQIKRQHARVKLQKDYLEMKKMQGELVSKEAVYKNLFAFGQELRESLLSLPDKIIDDVMASKDRNEGFLIMYDNLVAILEGLSDMQNRKIS